MTSIADGSVSIQTSSESNPSPPSWFGEVVVIAAYLRKHDILAKISERFRFARKRFGRYEVIDFLAVFFGYAISGERTLEAFYESIQPFAVAFMALFERDRLPSRSALSRFLAALTEEAVESLRTLFLDDLLDRPLTHDKQTGGLVDRKGDTWTVFDIDGTREAARQRALPQTDELPPPFRRLDDVCAPGYRGRKRGEVVRTRTTVLQAHSSQWLGSLGNRGNGRYREELRKGISAIGRYLAAHYLSQERTLIRLDGQYGNGAVLSDVAGFAFVTRGKDYRLLDHPLIQARLHLPPDQVQQRPESQMERSLYDCPAIPVGPEGTLYRVVVATHPAGKKKSPIGVTRKGVVYELARVSGGLTLSWQPMVSFCSDRLASPRGVLCPLFSSGAHLFCSAAWFALPLTRLAGSFGHPVRFCTTFASPSTISSSASSLRIAWAFPARTQCRSAGRSADFPAPSTGPPDASHH